MPGVARRLLRVVEQELEDPDVLLGVERHEARALGSEFLGTALLLAGVVGSGIMAERLSQGNDAVA